MSPDLVIGTGLLAVAAWSMTRRVEVTIELDGVVRFKKTYPAFLFFLTQADPLSKFMAEEGLVYAYADIPTHERLKDRVRLTYQTTKGAQLQTLVVEIRRIR